ncbi:MULTISPECIES: DUF3857 domain-containing transglutaminase family protein [Burkholderia]|uniref:DUF3857 domain-containing transglutaminase family protein n=1 Tax=Burkholderia TaxID=32008 RepID=UPI00085807F2|nr:MULTISPECIES: DUF3857 domain-containing transglutaminase family protein [unclassified Burkholderia]AOK31586.1 hypothetical protein AQ611_18710 [Burkholderia sp. Bp7605]
MTISRIRQALVRTAIAIACLCTNASFAALQPIDEAPIARHVDETCRINADTSTDCTCVTRLTILRPVGRDLLSRLDFDYRENDRFELKDAAVIDPHGHRTPLAASQIDTRTAPNPAEGFLRDKQTSVAFPDLRVGSTIAYTTIRHTAALPLAKQFHEVLAFPPTPVRTDHFRVEYQADRPIVWRSEAAGDFRIATSDGGKRLVITQIQPRYLNIVNEEYGELRQIPRIELASSLSAQAHFGAYAKRYNEIAAAPLPRGAASAVDAARREPAAQRVAALMHYIDTHYRYLGDWRACDRGYIPFELAQIEAHGYGDCKDLAVLLAAMLYKSGIDARIAWVHAGSFAPPLLIPGTQAPNHAIVRASVDGRTWWLDPTQPNALPGRTPAQLQDRWALVVEKNGDVRREHIPAEAPIVAVDATVNQQLRPDGSAVVSGHAYLDGRELLDLMRTDRHDGVRAGDQQICKRLLNEQEKGTCKIVRPRSDEARNGRYRIDMKGIDLRALEAPSGQNGPRVYDAAQGLRQLWDRFADYRHAGDAGDLYLNDPFTFKLHVRLTGAKAAQPLAACAVHSPWYDLEVAPEPSDNAIAYREQIVQKVRWLSHADLTSDAFGRFLDDARRCTNTLRQAVEF